MRKCVFAGTFDPFTVGHENTVSTCLKTFDEVVIAVMINRAKTTLLSVEDRVSLIKELYKEEKNVTVISFEGAAVDLLKEQNTPYYVRGVRNIIDFTYETDNYYASKKLMDDMITIYIPCEQQYLQVSSSLVRNSIAFNKEYDYLLPQKILPAFKAMLGKKNV